MVYYTVHFVDDCIVQQEDAVCNYIANVDNVFDILFVFKYAECMEKTNATMLYAFEARRKVNDACDLTDVDKCIKKTIRLLKKNNKIRKY